jgi:hypothetical protein
MQRSGNLGHHLAFDESAKITAARWRGGWVICPRRLTPDWVIVTKVAKKVVNFK